MSRCATCAAYSLRTLVENSGDTVSMATDLVLRGCDTVVRPVPEQDVVLRDRAARDDLDSTPLSHCRAIKVH